MCTEDEENLDTEGTEIVVEEKKVLPPDIKESWI